MRNWIITTLGGYPDIDSAVNHIKATNNEAAKNQLLTEAIKHLFNTISAEDILKVNGAVWTYRGRPLSTGEMTELREEAKFLQGMKLWTVLENDIKYQINKKLYLEANITTDMLWGKLITWYDDIIRTRLKSMTK